MSQPRAVSVALQKGGVGKTTVAINVAERLSNRGHDVLLVDLDQQGNATRAVGLEDAYTGDTHIGHVIDDETDVGARDVIHERDWFDVLPAHEELGAVESTIRNATFGELRIKHDVVEPLLGTEYDYVIVDTAPTISPLSDASLVATQHVLVPLLMSQPSLSGLDRMTTQQLDPLRRELPIDVIGVVPNRLEGDNEERRVLSAVEASRFRDRLPEFGRSREFDDPDSPGPGIRKRVSFRRAWRDGVPLAVYDPDSDMVERLDAVADLVEHGGVPEPDTED